MDYLVFDTEQEAELAQQSIFNLMEINEVNAGTGIAADPHITTRYAIPQQRVDGKWVIPAHESYVGGTIEQYQETWFSQI